MSPLRRLWGLLQPYSARIIAAFALAAVASSGLLAIPMIVRHLFGAASAQERFAVSPTQWAALVVAMLVVSAAGYVSHLLMFTTGYRVTSALRTRCADRLLRAPLRIHRDQNAGEMLDRLNDSLAHIEIFLRYGVAAGLSLAILFLGGTIMLFVLCWQLALLLMLALPVISAGLRMLFKRTRALDGEGNKASDRVAGRFHEMLLGMEVVKAFDAAAVELNRLRERQDQLLDVQLRSARLAALVEPLLVFVLLTLLCVVVFVGSRLLAAGEILPGELLAFLLYSLILIPQTRGLSRLQISFQQLGRSFQRLDQILNLPEETDLDRPAFFPAQPRGEIILQKVCYAYPDRERVFEDFSLTIGARQCVGIVGPSGAGKTTLFNLLLRFYSPQSGAIRIDGTDIRDARARDLRRMIALVPQDIMLFDDTLLENVRYGRPDASDEEVREACRAVRAHDFIMALPQQYQTVAGGRGLKLSGGQRQRLAIARALLKNAPILLMDEATSALDSQTELELREAMDAASEGRTTLIIAHRLATVVHLPRLLVLDDGRLLDEGTHEELMLRCETYRRLVSSQLIPLETGESDYPDFPKSVPAL